MNQIDEKKSEGEPITKLIFAQSAIAKFLHVSPIEKHINQEHGNSRQHHRFKALQNLPPEMPIWTNQPLTKKNPGNINTPNKWLTQKFSLSPKQKSPQVWQNTTINITMPRRQSKYSKRLVIS